MTSGLLNEIKDYLNNDFKYKVEVNSLAKSSLQGKYNLVSDGAALIFSDTVEYELPQSYIDTSKAKWYIKDTAIIVSIGVKRINNDGIELLDLIDEVESKLSFRTFCKGEYQLLPIAGTSYDGDIDNVQWKQIWFKARKKNRIQVGI